MTQSVFSPTVPVTIDSDVEYTVVMQAVDTGGIPLTAGGEIINLEVEDISLAVPHSAIVAPMTDNGDGTYEASFTLVATGGGIVSIKAVRYIPCIYAEYYTKVYNAFDPFTVTGLSYLTQIDSQIQFNWGSGIITPLNHKANAVIRWAGFIKSPVSGTVTFLLTCDKEAKFYIDWQQIIYSDKATRTASVTLVENTYYSFAIEYAEWTIVAHIMLDWNIGDGAGTVPIPASAFFYDGGSMGTYATVKRSSVPS